MKIDIKSLLNDHGLKATPQRIAVYTLIHDKGHLTAEQVVEMILKKDPNFNRSTVYNTLNNLVDAGILNKIRTPSKEETIYDTKLDNHHHFIDEHGNLHDIDEKDIQLKLKGKTINGNIFIIGNKEDL